MKNKLLIGGLAVVIIGVIAFVGLYHKGKDNALGGYIVTSTPFSYEYSDVFGTHITTSTVGVLAGATTTKVSAIGRNISEATYMIIPTAIASTTASYLSFFVEMSNDPFCDVTTTTVAHEYNKQHINWFNAMNNLKGNVHQTSFTSASSSQILTWTNLTGLYGQTINLVDLNARCLRLSMGGVSTTVYVGVSTKSKQ